MNIFVEDVVLPNTKLSDTYIVANLLHPLNISFIFVIPIVLNDVKSNSSIWLHDWNIACTSVTLFVSNLLTFKLVNLLQL